jgi:hypothetical protein
VSAWKHRKLAHWDDERASGDSLIATLQPGWRFEFDQMPTHVGGFDTVKEARAAVRSAVACHCSECLASADRPQPAASAASPRKEAP